MPFAELNPPQRVHPLDTFRSCFSDPESFSQAKMEYGKWEDRRRSVYILRLIAVHENKERLQYLNGKWFIVNH